jgi:hypothetical protein
MSIAISETEVATDSTAVNAIPPSNRIALCVIVIVTQFLGAGCAVIRYADYGMPGIRFDRPSNRPLPPRDDSAVQAALDRWNGMSVEDRLRYPSPYHAYVDTPAMGSFEGDHVIGLAFSGGGTRGTVFGAACVRELMDLGPIVVSRPEGDLAIQLVDEIDYVTGVSTGAIPAALFALSYGESCPETMQRDRWPDCFNVNVTKLTVRHLLARPDLFLRDMTFELNSRYALSSAIAAAFFEGKPNHPASGLTFADLPARPVLIIGATVIHDPSVPFMQTRLPYRYAINQELDYPWQTGIQSFETFHSDPLRYPLGEASYSSSSFPGHLRAGQMKVQEDESWVYEGLDGATLTRMRAARNQAGYAGTYAIKDGGLVDNRGSYVIHCLYEALMEENPPARKPLLVSLDAGFLELRPTQEGSGILKQGWMSELQSSMRASWQTGQDAYNAMIEATAGRGVYDYARLRFTAWVPFMASENAADDSDEGVNLRTLCANEPLVGSPQSLLEILRPIGTTFRELTPEEMAAIRLCARFAVWIEKDGLLRWASDLYGGAPARFANDTT